MADNLYPVPNGARHNSEHPFIQSLDVYYGLYRESISSPDEFFLKRARELLTWTRQPTKGLNGDFLNGSISWFEDGELNVSTNCIDRHARQSPDKVAIIWESDEPGGKKITYKELLENTCRVANALLNRGVRKGDTVAIYMPMIPEAVYSMLACARIGALHSVIFAGFSAEALRDRINDARCKVLLTADEGKRGGKTIHLKKVVDEALIDCETVECVIVFRRTGNPLVPLHHKRDIYWDDEVDNARPYCPAEVMNAEDPLFLLYTSGSTGKPKGVLHTQAGYLLGAALTLKYSFDIHDGDIFGCMADVGWITGHSYIVYGPLCLGVTTVIFESIPTYPNAGRYWDLVSKHNITHFYTAPTAIRALKKLGDEWVQGYDMKRLRVLGSVGEPINPEAWKWYHNVVGRCQCSVIDTYWQTETGSFLIAPYACATPTSPGSATLPQFGISPVILDSNSGEKIDNPTATGVLCLDRPWPSMARSIYKGHKRYLETYFCPYPGYYFTGDGAARSENGYYTILGRVDDVINVSGHRLSTAEIESALVAHPLCAEAAVVGIPDDITGQAIFLFVCMKQPVHPSEARSQLTQQIRKVIGPFAAPKYVAIVPDLPKTRSGKIMRRILRKLASQESVVNLGDMSTLADPSIIDSVVEVVKTVFSK